MNRKTGGAYHYYAFEAEYENYESIIKYCAENEIKNVKVFNLAVSDRKKSMFFDKDGNSEKVGGKISDEMSRYSDVVQADLIDNVLGDVEIDMITMDIEGAELRALKGAAKCIKAYSPKLAISAYHEVNHLWEIPLLIKEINPAYHIFFRHHRWNMHDTVCYAVADDKDRYR